MLFTELDIPNHQAQMGPTTRSVELTIHGRQMTEEKTINVPGLEEAAKAVVELVKTEAQRRQRDATWTGIKRAFIGVVVLGFLAFYLLFYSRVFGVNANPATEAVAIIPIKGAIAQGADASSENIVPLIEKACESDKVKYIALDINSPGGSPNEAERIVQSIKVCKRDHGKKVYGVISEMGASAAFMVVMHTDEIVAGKYSVVGSIGAIMRYVDASVAANKLGVNEHIFKSGPLKGGVTMLSGGDEELNKVNQEMVETLGRDFLSELYEVRKGKLKAAPEVVFTGRIWTSNQSLQMGLIDRIGTMESLSDTDWKHLKLHRYAVKQAFVKSFGFKSMVKNEMTELTNMGTPVLE